ncbi:MAG: LysR family transcriptional regulator [Chitinophagaceae bacterium]
MEIRHFRLVKTIVEAGSIAKAINILHLSASALSYQLKEAETQLGTAIFHRAGKKLILTEAGKKVLTAASVILNQLDDVQQEVKQLIKHNTGSIRIATECYTGYHWLPALMKNFRAEFPGIDINIAFEATHQPIQKLAEGKLDLAITSDPIADNKITYTELFNDEMLAVVSADHPWAARQFVIAEDFKDQNLFIHSEPLETVTIHQRLLQPSGIKPQKITVLPLTEASVEMVKADMGVMVMAQWALRPYLHDPGLRFIKVTPQGLVRTQYVAQLASPDPLQHIAYFIKYLREHLVDKNGTRP